MFSIVTWAIDFWLLASLSFGAGRADGRSQHQHHPVKESHFQRRQSGKGERVNDVHQTSPSSKRPVDTIENAATKHERTRAGHESTTGRISQHPQMRNKS